MKTISQNPERYSKQGTNWVISASPDIKPIYLPIGVSLTNLKPVIKANGIIVKVGESYLCSITTLNEIKQSNNPHYDIVENGKIKVKDKEVVIGKTIKIIELDITKLKELADSRNFMNLQYQIEVLLLIQHQKSFTRRIISLIRNISRVFSECDFERLIWDK